MVVVSPFIALMKDQVRAMSERNMKAVYAGEVDKDSQTEHDVMAGRYQLVFMRAYHQNLVGLVVHEAHCVQEW